MKIRGRVRLITTVQLLPFLWFMNVTGYWHCGDKVCGYWLFKSCCEHPNEVEESHIHDALDHGAHFAPVHHADCAFQLTTGSDYSPSSALTVSHPPPVIVPSAGFVSVDLPLERPILIREGRGPPGRNLAFLQLSLRAPPLS